MAHKQILGKFDEILVKESGLALAANFPRAYRAFDLRNRF